MTRYYLLVVFLFIQQSSLYAGDDPLVIAISKFDSKGYDTVWLKHFTKNVRFVNLYKLPMREAMVQLKQSNALLVTGGEDVDPALYGKGNELKRCEEPDYRRDTLEIAAIKFAMQMQIPVLGICRGEQIMNVANGGTLIIDIPGDIGKSVQHNTLNKKPAMHMVRLDRASRLYNIIKQDSGIVNSFHHQCVERVAPGFTKAATTRDHIIEAIELNDFNRFVFGVQWHPEQLPANSPFAYNLGKAFIAEANRIVASRKK